MRIAASNSNPNPISPASPNESAKELSIPVVSQESQRAITPASLSYYQMMMFLECFQLMRQLSRDEWMQIRDQAEQEIMKAADKSYQDQLTQGWWTMGSGIAGGVLKLSSAALGGAALVHTAKWLEIAGKVTHASGEAALAIGQGGASLQGAQVGSSQSLYEQIKRRMEAMEKYRQSHETCERTITQLFDAWMQSEAAKQRH